MALAEKLIKDGEVEAGLRFMDLEVELSGGRVWMIRKAAQAQLSYGTPQRALSLAKQGLASKPDDETLEQLRKDAERLLEESP